MTLRHSVITLRDGFKVGVIQSDNTDGTPLVLLHGWSVSAFAYTEVLEHLEKLGFRVIALDAPGHGRSDALHWGHGIRDMARIVRAALDALHVMGEAVIVGHSMGGAMAVEYAAMFPGNVAAAILLNPAAGQSHHDAIRVVFTPEGVLRVAELLTGALRDVIGDTALAAENRSGTELLSLGSRLAKSFSGASILKAGVALLKSDTHNALRALKRWGVPTVIIHGSDDHIVSAEAAFQAAVTSGARLRILNGRNHSWMVSDAKHAATIVAGEARSILEKIA